MSKGVKKIAIFSKYNYNVKFKKIEILLTILSNNIITI
jgi:hypothetical protein